MLRVALGGLAVLAGLATGAAAQSAPQKWSGLYIGASVGYEWNAGDATYAQDFNASAIGFALQRGGANVPAFSRTANSGDGATVGGHIGYNLQSGPFVYGVEADLRARNSDFSYTETFTGFNDVLTFSGENKYAGTVRARLGVSALGSLLFVTGATRSVSRTSRYCRRSPAIRRGSRPCRTTSPDGRPAGASRSRSIRA